MLDLVGVCYVLDAVVLLLYAQAGTISANVGPALAGCGLAAVGVFLALSQSGINDRFRDHYWVIPQTGIHLAIQITFAYLFPEVGFMFLCALFTLCSFSALRATQRQALLAWSMMAFAVTALLMAVDQPMSLPHATPLERFATILALVLALGRCMFLGMVSASLRDKLYKRGVELKQAYETIEELAELDELTGSFNRRCIMRVLDDEIVHARRIGTPLSIALIDLDWFKRINDVYGHPAGDEVLKTFAITIFANIRAIDKFGRYGGEEFLLILPATPQDAAVQLLERLRGIVADLDWSAFSEGMLVTLSAGIATLTENETSDTLLARADCALYEAKANGRNRIAASSPEASATAPSNCPPPYMRVAP
uniref:diguanylate cyclase n=1 Tax=Rhodopseudomonas palustris (strain BisA53) TaxID=316055 RepID=Q07QJ7_RHOP5